MTRPWKAGDRVLYERHLPFIGTILGTVISAKVVEDIETGEDVEVLAVQWDGSDKTELVMADTVKRPVELVE